MLKRMRGSPTWFTAEGSLSAVGGVTQRHAYDLGTRGCPGTRSAGSMPCRNLHATPPLHYGHKKYPQIFSTFFRGEENTKELPEAFQIQS